MAFVACNPLADAAGIISQPASGSYSNHLDPRALRSEGVMLSPPSTLSGPIRQARSPPLTSQDLWLYRRPRPTTWSGLRPSPSLLWVSTPSTRAITSTPGGEAGPYPRCIPAPLAFLTSEMSRLLHHPDIGFSRVHISTLLPVFASLRPAWLLALLDRSDLEKYSSPAAERFVPELSLREVTLSVSRALLHSTPGRRRDRTFTGWSTAVTGCTQKVWKQERAV
jgi:hypothetical protein